jgi:hypothetical protein
MAKSAQRIKIEVVIQFGNISLSFVRGESLAVGLWSCVEQRHPLPARIPLTIHSFLLRHERKKDKIPHQTESLKQNNA